MATIKSLLDGLEAATIPFVTQVLSTLPPMQFIAPVISHSGIYVFGDSLSDAGNVAAATFGYLPASPYSAGRFSNGNVWVQDLAHNLGLPAVTPSLRGGNDFAFGGAETGTTAVHTANPTDLGSQLAQFVAKVPHPSPNALYTVWAGSNDVLGIANSKLTPSQQQLAVQQAVANETAFIKGLIAHGAKHLVVMDVPDLSKTPYETARPASDAASGADARLYNAGLGAAIWQIVASGAASIDYVDTYTLLDSAIAHPASYGFTNVTQPVWTGNLTSTHGGALNASGAAQNGYLFFDNLHPTAAGHTYLAAAVTQSLTATA